MLVRIVGYILNEEKQLFISLLSIFGIGRTTALKICKDLNIDALRRVKTLNEREISLLNDHINKNYKFGDDLKKELLKNIKQSISSGSFHGRRLKYGLPAHGQKSRSNAKTSRKVKI